MSLYLLMQSEAFRDIPSKYAKLYYGFRFYLFGLCIFRYLSHNRLVSINVMAFAELEYLRML